MKSFGVYLLLVILLAACTAATMETGVPTDLPILPTLTATPSAAQPTTTHTPFPSLTATPTSSPQPSPTPGPMICSPLADISLAELPEILTNPFVEPQSGRDNGHHGCDFAYYSRGEHKVILGLPVQSLMSGKVAAVVLDKPPYGYAILIETQLDLLLLARPSIAQNLPTPAPTIQPDARLTCPTLDPQPSWPAEKTSVYFLYAHFESAPVLKVGDAVTCGQVIGNVGTSGMSVNPHLHLEARIGPPGVNFASMGHYGSVSQIEMANYCLWRASQWFQMFDPLLLMR